MNCEHFKLVMSYNLYIYIYIYIYIYVTHGCMNLSRYTCTYVAMTSPTMGHRDLKNVRIMGGGGGHPEAAGPEKLDFYKLK